MRAAPALLALCSALLLGCLGDNDGAPRAPEPYVSATPRTGSIEEYATLSDPSRAWDDDGTEVTPREIPIKMYVPEASAPGNFPVVLVSHGLGGNSDEAVAYAAVELASRGYIVVSVQHHRSDTDYLQELTQEYGPIEGKNRFLLAANQPQTRALRPVDMTFVLDWLSDASNTQGSAVHDRMDLAKVGVLGHSFGAWTTLACLGQTFDGGLDMSDPRFLCGVAYSPQAPGTAGIDADAWAGLASPVLTMGGTLDVGPGTDDPAERRAAFDGMPATGTKYHATLAGAEHSDFGGGSEDGFYYDWIVQMTLAFFDANLKDIAAAKSWLDSEDIEPVSSGYVALERK